MADRNGLDLNLGDGVRNRMRKLSHRAFDLLIMLGDVSGANRLENLVVFAASLGLAALSGVGAYLIAGVIAPGQAITATLIAAFAGLILGSIVFGVVFSARTLRGVNRFSIYHRRRAPGKKYAAIREAMISLISDLLKGNPGLPISQLTTQYGRDLRGLLPAKLTASLDRIKRTKGSVDYIVFRGLMERKYKPVYVAEGFRARRPREGDGEDPRSYYVRARDLRNALKINLIFRYLDADLRDETPDGENWRREYFTAPERQHLTLWDENDLPTRFRTFAPHLRWPDDVQLARDARPTSAGETATYVAIEGIENPLELPLYLLTLDDIEAAMVIAAPIISADVETGKISAENHVADAIRLLCAKPVPMFAKKDKNTLRALGGVDAPELTVLRRGREGVLEIRWDPNRILWERLDPATTSELLAALALVLKAIDLCISDTLQTKDGPRATPVILRRGDLLITDNQRTLVCRREADFYSLRRSTKLGVRLPPQWWMRGFYGFRIASPDAQREGGATSRRLDGESDAMLSCAEGNGGF